MNASDLRAVLKKYWGYDDFRGIQLEIIESICAGRDTLGLMPTGGGKSITFQVPAMTMPGLCLVVSPLIALMKDQVANLKRKGILAQAIYTGMSHDEVLIALDNCTFGHYKFLYVSPERLSSELFMARVRRMDISFIAVDEAHCISQWGFDFRPAYRTIADIRRILPGRPVLALTATATPEVVTDIQRQLQFKEPNVFKMSFMRKNLSYNVKRIRGSAEEEIATLLNTFPGAAIIYTRSRQKTEAIAEWLTTHGTAATFYHAGIRHADKTLRQEQFQHGDIRVMVATNAFGMGIDKADVRLVIHVDVPDSPEAYFQEAGRAGRDGQMAHACLLVDRRSASVLHNRIEETFPPIAYVRRVYEDMCLFLQMAMGDGEGVTREFDIRQFCVNFRHYPNRAYSALMLLDRAGYISWQNPEESRSRVMFVMRRDELYDLHLKPTEDRVMYFILRHHTGVFSEYVYISEAHIAEELGVAETVVSEALVALSRQHVIRFIPRTFVPHITFVSRRIEPEEITLQPSIYQERRAQMEKRIETMISYINSPYCRSTLLLNYFGEHNAKECGICDNCRGGTMPELSITDADISRLSKVIIELLKQNGPTFVRDIKIPSASPDQIGHTLHELLLNEQIATQPDDPTIVMLK